MNVVDERIARIQKIMDRLPVIEARLDEIEKQVMCGGMTAGEFQAIVTERSNLLLERKRLEQKMKHEYRIMLDKESEDIIINTEDLN